MVAFIVLSLLASVHYLGAHFKKLTEEWKGWSLSFAGGVSVAYLFVDLMPSLAKGELAIQSATGSFFEHHVYILALLGVIFTYGMDELKGRWMVIGGYVFFNIIVGYTVGDASNLMVHPLSFFTLAMALHYLIKDHLIRMKDPHWFDAWGWMLPVCGLYTGWAISLFTQVSEEAIAVPVSFIAGGVMMNVFQHEIPNKTHRSFIAFSAGAALNTALILLRPAGY